MEVEHLLGEDWQFATFQRVDSTVVVVVNDDREPPFEDVMVTAFDLREGFPLRREREFIVRGPPHLGVLTSLRPEPVLAHLEPEGLVVAEPGDGRVLKRLPLVKTPGWPPFADAYDLVLNHHEGRDLLFLHEDLLGSNDRVWRVYDLATGVVPDPGVRNEHVCYKEVSGRLTFRHGYLAHPTCPEVVDYYPDDFHVVDAVHIEVHREGDGTGPFLGSVRTGLGTAPEDRAVDIAHAAGRTYLAEAGDLFTLPELERVFPEDFWAVVSRVTEWAGRPVAVFVRKPAHLDEGRDGLIYEPIQLSFTFLDEATPVWHVLRWTVPLRPFDLLATPEGTIMVSSEEGVHVVRVGPEEAVRSAERA